MLPNPYVLLGTLLAVIAIAAASFGYGRHVESLAFDKYKAEQRSAASAQVASNQTAVAAITASEAEGLRQIASTAQESRDEIQKRNEALVAANSDLARRLREYVTRPGVTATHVPQPATGSGGSDAAGSTSLPDGFQNLAQWVTAELRDADNLAVTLVEAQQVILQDRQMCNGQLPGVTPEQK